MKIKIFTYIFISLTIIGFSGDQERDEYNFRDQDRRFNEIQAETGARNYDNQNRRSWTPERGGRDPKSSDPSEEKGTWCPAENNGNRD